MDVSELRLLALEVEDELRRVTLLHRRLVEALEPETERDAKSGLSELPRRSGRPLADQ